MASTDNAKFIKVDLTSEQHRRLRQIAASTDEPMVKVATREIHRFIKDHPVARMNQEWEQRAKK
jgi:hypothetical protein